MQRMKILEDEITMIIIMILFDIKRLLINKRFYHRLRSIKVAKKDL